MMAVAMATVSAVSGVAGMLVVIGLSDRQAVSSNPMIKNSSKRRLYTIILYQCEGRFGKTVISISAAVTVDPVGKVV